MGEWVYGRDSKGGLAADSVCRIGCYRCPTFTCTPCLDVVHHMWCTVACTHILCACPNCLSSLLKCLRLHAAGADSYDCCCSFSCSCCCSCCCGCDAVCSMGGESKGLSARSERVGARPGYGVHQHNVLAQGMAPLTCNADVELVECHPPLTCHVSLTRARADCTVPTSGQRSAAADLVSICI